MRFINRFAGVLVIVLLLAACGGGGGGGVVSIPPVPSPVPLDGGEGTTTNPISVALNTPRSSTVGAFDDSYYFFTTTTAGTYIISLTNPTTDVSWDLYANSDFTGWVSSCDKYWSVTAEQCTVTLQAGKTYYLMVSEFASGTGTFTLTIRQITSEGSTASPVDLTVGTTHSGSVGQSGISYYRFKPAHSVAHTITSSNAVPSYSSITVKVYSTDFTSLSPVLLKTCGPGYNLSCTVNGLSAGSYYYVEVDGNSYNAVQYDITVAEGLSEGSIAAPLELIVGDPAHNGAVDASGMSYYKFTTLDSSGEYIITLSGSTTPYLDVYSSADFSAGYVGSCTAGQPCRLNGLDAKSVYYVKVRNSTASSVTYQIGVADGATEGSVKDPVALTVDTAAHNAVVDSSGTAYYSFQTTAYSGSYTISLTATQRNLSWALYDTATSSYAISTCNAVTTAGAGDESCPTTNLDSNKTYYIRVTNNESTGSSNYGISVATGGGSEGSKNNPLLISGLTHTGSVIKNGYSYYSFTTGASAVTYVIALTSMQADLDWTLHTDGGFVSSIVSCRNYIGSSDDEICSTQGTYLSPVLAANTTYYLSVYNRDSVASTYLLTLMPLDPAAGCSGNAAECFNFEDGVVPAGFNLTTVGGKGQWKWYIDGTNPAGSGTKSIRSGTISYPEQTCFDYTPAAKPNSVTFSLKTDTASTLWAYIIIDGASTYSLGYWSGVTPWRKVASFTGSKYGGTTHTFQWCFKRDYPSTSGSETVWVDDIEFK